MSRQRRYQLFDASLRLVMLSSRAALLHVRLCNVLRQRQYARFRQVGDMTGPVHPLCMSADFCPIRNATVRWDGVDSCPSLAQFVCHTGRTSYGE